MREEETEKKGKQRNKGKPLTQHYFRPRTTSLFSAHPLFLSPPPAPFPRSSATVGFNRTRYLLMSELMECIEARALKKSSYLSEFAMNSSQQALIDDFLCMNGINGVSSDDFSVDVFLDLSNEDFKDELVRGEEESEEEEKDFLSVSSQERERVEDEICNTSRAEDEICNTSNFSGTGDSSSLPAGDLSVPVDDLENLEWLSQFVDDSASDLSLLCPAGNFIGKTATNAVSRTEPAVQGTTPVLCFPSTVPAKARTKRQRTGGRVWSNGSSESSCEYSPSSVLLYPKRLQTPDFAEEVVKPPTVKKSKKKRAAPEADGGERGGAPLFQRRCSHCLVQKTPQWRNGPLGPKTLCNACGVRFKSGRLFPEYRPACSPTFSGALHSNSHRKVLEMRRKKEITGAGDEPGSMQ